MIQVVNNSVSFRVRTFQTARQWLHCASCQCSQVEFDPSGPGGDVLWLWPGCLSHRQTFTGLIHSLCRLCKWIHGFCVFWRQESLSFSRRVSYRRLLCHLLGPSRTLLLCQHQTSQWGRTRTRRRQTKAVLNMQVGILCSFMENITASTGCVSLFGFTAQNQECPAHVDHISVQVRLFVCQKKIVRNRIESGQEKYWL